jgi:hypothetical protein
MSLKKIERGQRLDMFLHDTEGSTERIHYSTGREREATGRADFTKRREGEEESQSKSERELDEFIRSVTEMAIIDNARQAWEKKI